MWRNEWAVYLIYQTVFNSIGVINLSFSRPSHGDLHFSHIYIIGRKIYVSEMCHRKDSYVIRFTVLT